MEHINTITKQISQVDFTRVEFVSGFIIRDFTVEFAKMCKNIRETSVGEADRRDRVMRLAEESGINFLEVNKLC